MKYDWIVIGAGAGGLVVAIGGAKAGKKVLLIERNLFGGDCTNFGCIPSKSLIASAEIAKSIKNSKKFGIDTEETFNADQSLERVRKIVAEVRSHEEPDALEKMGVHVLKGEASFVNPHTLRVKQANVDVTGSKIIIATGGRPSVPPIEGLNETPFLTNETIFNLKAIPKRLLIIGGGPIGSELAQAFARLGSRVTLFQRRNHLLPREESFAHEIIEKRFCEEGIELVFKAQIKRVQYDQVFQVEYKENQIATGDTLLVAVGRTPNIEELKLENAGIDLTIDAYGRTSEPHIFALGDVVGPPFFTHKAEHQARTLLANLLIPFFKRKFQTTLPRVTFTDPEIASIGISTKEASGNIATYTVPFTEVDRAITQGETDGVLFVITKKWSSKILGATIVGPRAGEMLAQISLAMQQNIPLRKLANIIPPYPTYSIAVRKAADKWLTKTILRK